MRTIFWCCLLASVASIAAGQCSSYDAHLAAHGLTVVAGMAATIATAVAYGRLASEKQAKVVARWRESDE